MGVVWGSVLQFVFLPILDNIILDIMPFPGFSQHHVVSCGVVNLPASATALHVGAVCVCGRHPCLR